MTFLFILNIYPTNISLSLYSAKPNNIADNATIILYGIYIYEYSFDIIARIIDQEYHC